MTLIALTAFILGQDAGPKPIQSRPPTSLDAIYGRQSQIDIPSAVQVKANVLIELPDTKLAMKFIQAHFDFHHYLSVIVPNVNTFESAGNEKQFWTMDQSKKSYSVYPVETEQLSALEYREFLFAAWNKEFAKGFGGAPNDDDPFKIRMQVSPHSIPMFSFVVNPKVVQSSKKTVDGKTQLSYDLEGTFDQGAVMAKIVTSEEGMIESMLFDLTYEGYLATITVTRTEYKETKAKPELFDISTRDLKGYTKQSG